MVRHNWHNGGTPPVRQDNFWMKVAAAKLLIGGGA